MINWLFIFSFIENVALRGRATQAHSYEHAFSSASNGIDGNKDSTFSAGSCTHTNEQTNPWWRLDLLDPYIVTSIVITNRGDCCEFRINGLQIHIGNSLHENGVANPMWVNTKMLFYLLCLLSIFTHFHTSAMFHLNHRRFCFAVWFKSQINVHSLLLWVSTVW